MRQNYVEARYYDIIMTLVTASVRSVTQRTIVLLDKLSLKGYFGNSLALQRKQTNDRRSSVDRENQLMMTDCNPRRLMGTKTKM